MARNKYNKEIRPTFFKVLIGDFSKQLRIPPAFLKNFNGSSLEKCIFQGPAAGRYWVVNVEKVENLLYFGNGWQDFVQYHCLEFGDFLLFKYCGNSRFKVKIYDKTCCEKAIKQPQMKNDHPNLHSKELNQNEARPITLQCKPEICKTVNKTEPMNFNSSGCTRQLEKKPVTEEGSKPTRRSFLSFKSDNSCFILNWTDNNRYSATIPAQLVREKMLRTKREVVLNDPVGRSWAVELFRVNDGRLNMKGGTWLDFYRGNEIETMDILIFEFIMPTVLQVHIFREGGGSKRIKTMVFSSDTVKKLEAQLTWMQ